MFCKHVWQEERIFVPPISGVRKLENVTSYSAKQILWGYTNIYRACAKCGKDKSTTLIGDFTYGI